MKSKWIFKKIQLQLLSDQATNQPFNAIYLTLFLQGPKHPFLFFFFTFLTISGSMQKFLFLERVKKKSFVKWIMVINDLGGVFSITLHRR